MVMEEASCLAPRARVSAAAPEASLLTESLFLVWRMSQVLTQTSVIEGWDAAGDMPTGLIPNCGPFRGDIRSPHGSPISIHPVSDPLSTRVLSLSGYDSAPVYFLFPLNTDSDHPLFQGCLCFPQIACSKSCFSLAESLQRDSRAASLWCYRK